MKIIFFTNKCSHGAELLTEIKQNNIKLDAIFLRDAKQTMPLKKQKRSLKEMDILSCCDNLKKK